MTVDTLLVVGFAWLGLAVGSFLNVCIHRVPRRTSIVRPPSRCPHCGYELRWFDNIPVVSYVLLRGRCRRCRAPISIRYPIVELITMGVFLLHYWVWGWDPILVPRLLFACALIVLFAIDLEHQLLPDVITLPGIVVGLIFSTAFPPGLKSAFLGMLLGGGVLFVIAEVWSRLRNVDAMGGGDIKMLAMVGAFLGVQGTAVTFVIASYLGGLTGIALIVSRRGGMMSKVPFGTFLAVAALIASLYGEQMVSWYVGLYE
jgi:leader peptidase (prepilin peptidase) / N-methyltransferase